MATFTYKARTRQGEILQDNLDGADTMAVASQLRQQGLLVIDIKEQGVGQKDLLGSFKNVKLGDLVIFTRQFSTMINAGLPIVRTLYVLSEQTDNAKLKEAVVLVRKDVEAGLALSEALEKHPKIFDRLYIEMVRAGETGGILDGVLLRIADQLEGDQDLRRKVKSAMTYPTVVLVIALLAASFMLILIVPVFAKMFEDLGGTLPLPTQVAMGASDILTSFFGVLIYAALGAGNLTRWVGRKELVRAALLTSTRANPHAPVDALSDYDVVLVVEDVRPLFEDKSWLGDFGEVLVEYWDPIYPDPDYGIEQTGNVVQYADGLRIDFRLWPVALARRVAEGSRLPDDLDVGYAVLVDKDRLFDEMRPPTYTAYVPSRPDEETYLTVVNDFFSAAPDVAKCLLRDELFPAKWCLDYDMKHVYLRRMLEWRMELDHGWSEPTGNLGKGLKNASRPTSGGN
jgi:hypothetical protein